MNIIEKLKQFNVEVTPEMEKAFSGEFLSEKEVDKKLSKLQTENESLKERAESAEGALKKFDGKDLDAMQKELEDWKEKANKAESEYNSKMAEHEKQELLKEAFAEIEFTSESAKKAIMAQIAENVSVKNGKLIGFNDLLEDAKKNDASAFVDKADKPKITSSVINNGNTNAGTLTKKDIMSIKDTTERQQKIAENVELFR